MQLWECVRPVRHFLTKKVIPFSFLLLFKQSKQLRSLIPHFFQMHSHGGDDCGHGHGHGAVGDNLNLRAILVHMMADCFSCLVVIGNGLLIK
jgi:Co/Zn/Cd efflux system component